MDSREINLVQVTCSLDHHLGGPTSVVLATSEFLSSTFNCTTIVLGSNKLLKQAIKIPTLLNNRFGIPSKIPNLATIRKIKEADVLLLHGFYLFSTLVVLAINSEAKIVVMPHGSLEKYQQSKSKIRKFIFERCANLLLHQRKLHFFVASPSEAEPISHKFKDTHIYIVGLGITVNQSFQFQKKLGDQISLLSFSRIARKKRIDLIIRATKELIDLGYNCKLDIYGDGNPSLIRELDHLINELGVGQKVKFWGHVEGEQASDAFINGSIFVLPSENENFAIAVAEAISYGVPTVVSKFVAMQEFTELHKTGVVIANLEVKELTAAITTVINDYGKFARNAYDSRSLLSWANVLLNWKMGILDIVKSENLDE